jgi:hypothetical protein
MTGSEEPPVPSGEPPLWPAPQSASRGQLRELSLSRDELRRTLRERPLAGDERYARPKSFPTDGEIEYERSVIRIPFTLKGREETERRRVDVMSFDAYMRILRLPAFRNGLGLRQFEFYIDAWELSNTFSQGLNTDITFTLNEDAVQPKSVCTAQQRDSDYPAMIVYNAIYDVYVGRERIITAQPGTAVATPVWSTPPRNVTVAFEKPFDSDNFAFSAGTCEGMRGITSEEFEIGARSGRRARGLE